jgi:hypothetical protein
MQLSTTATALMQPQTLHWYQPTLLLLASYNSRTYRTPDINVGIVTSTISIPTQLRTRSVAEKTTLVPGNTVACFSILVVEILLSAQVLLEILL